MRRCYNVVRRNSRNRKCQPNVWTTVSLSKSWCLLHAFKESNLTWTGYKSSFAFHFSLSLLFSPASSLLLLLLPPNLHDVERLAQRTAAHVPPPVPSLSPFRCWFHIPLASPVIRIPGTRIIVLTHYFCACNLQGVRVRYDSRREIWPVFPFVSCQANDIYMTFQAIGFFRPLF